MSLRIGSHLLLTLALLTPFAVLLLFPEVISTDILTFELWTRCLNTFTGPPYPECSLRAINYPTIGFYSSSGVLQLLQHFGLSGSDLAIPFQLYLGVIDDLNTLLMYLLLRGLKVPYASAATLVFALLPSTRVGGNLWGQIDGLSQFFLSLGFLCGLRSLNALEGKNDSKALRYLTGLSLSIVGAVLTKPLVFFSLPALGVPWLVAAIRLIMRHKAPQLALVFAITSLVGVALDQLFPTPSGYYGSGLLYVLTTGTEHANRIVYNGMNLFCLLPLIDSDSSKATYPLFSLWGNEVAIRPFYGGLALFLSSTAAASWLGVKAVYTNRLFSGREITVVCLVAAAACNLFMNTALTGTHERYLYHYGFFVFPAALALSKNCRYPRALIACLLVHLTLYGAFVYYILRDRMNDPVTWLLQGATASGNILLSLFLLVILLEPSLFVRRQETDEPRCR